MQVDFMVIGAMKSGTTALSFHLAANPQICFSRRQEPHFFIKPDYSTGELAKYHELFTPKAGQICGEGSTSYTAFPINLHVPETLQRYNPNLKLLYIMRQPVERIVSQFNHNYLRKTAGSDYHSAVLSEPDYVNRSRYALQIEPFMDRFGRERILLLLFEDFVRDRQAVYDQACAFLGVASVPLQDLEERHNHPTQNVAYLTEPGKKLLKSRAFRYSKPIRRLIPAGLRQRIRQRAVTGTLKEKMDFAPEFKRTLWQLVKMDVLAMEGLMGRQLSVWRDGYDQED